MNILRTHCLIDIKLGTLVYHKEYIITPINLGSRDQGSNWT